jgi:hypothetical protein
LRAVGIRLVGYRRFLPLDIGVRVSPRRSSAAAQRQATLATVVAKIDELLQQQSERNAAKQVASSEIQLLIRQGRELARDIKLDLKGSLGARSI